MKTPIVEYEGDQLEIDFSEIGFDPDRPQSSICPKCSSDIIRLADGCRICGWSENESKNDDRSVESSISIPCTVKQPNQPVRSGVIKQDLGSRFLVYIPSENSTVTVSKLFVYPDLSKLDKSPRKKIHPSKNCSSKQSPPCKIPPSKTRRRKGEGTGYIYRRTITRRGNQYQESYYRYRDESGKLRSKYIPQRLLDRVLQAESRSLSVADVLKLLGGLEISRGEQFSTSAAGNVQKSDELISLSRGEQASPPCTKNLKRPKRQQGYGAGYVECRKVKRGSKLYSQFWYHYEVWSNGDRVIKKSRYIPKRLVPKVERMNNEKAPVEKILKVLQNRTKRKR